MFLVIGVLAALLEARAIGQGQVVDAAIVDGAAHLSTMFAGMLASGACAGAARRPTCSTAARRSTTSTRPPTASTWPSARWSRSSTPSWCGCSGSATTPPGQADLARWPRAARPASTARFAERTRAEWTAVFDGTDACVAPVLPLTEAARHPHLAARGTYVERDGLLQPAPAPRFSRTGATLGAGPSVAGGQTRAALTAWGVPDVDGLLASGAAVQA